MMRDFCKKNDKVDANEEEQKFDINEHLCYNKDSDKYLDKRITDLSKMPLSLDVTDIARILGVSKQNAYRICHSRNFPCVITGKRLVIPKKAFELWMENPFIFERKD